jgi:KDO2-lipid IV(A) lauroyltransferase
LSSNESSLAATRVRFWGHVGRIYAEYCVLHKLIPQGRVTVDDESTLHSVLSDGRPVIAPFVHLGNWETCGSMLSLSAPGRVCALANPPPANRTQAQIAAMQRARLPGKTLAFDSHAWRNALQHLQAPGGILFVAVDEQVDGRISLPSFGRTVDPHANAHMIVRLAARTGAIIMPLYSERIVGATFCTHVLPPIEMPRQDKLARDERVPYVARLDALFGAAVLRLIDQWFGLLDFHRQSLPSVAATRANIGLT